MQSDTMMMSDSESSSDSDSEDFRCSSNGDHPTPSMKETATATSQKSPDHDLNVDTIKVQLSKRETRAVNRLRFIFMMIKLIVAGTVAFTVFHLTTKTESEDFDLSYGGASGKVIGAFLEVVNQSESLVALSRTVTMYSLDQPNASWPFITVSYYQERAASVRSLSGALYISLLHLVTDHQRREWEKYSQDPARNWINDGLEFNTNMGYDSFFHQNQSSFPNISTISYYNSDNELTDDPGPGPYLPRWMFSPAVASQVINQNLFKKNGSATYLHQCVEQKQAVFRSFEYGPPGPMDSDNNITSFFATLRSIKEGHQVDYLGDPMARLYIPIFDSMQAPSHHQDSKNVVAVLASLVHWRSYFRNLLPSDINGVDVVIANTCDAMYTYRINGTEADIVGFGDLHDTRLDAYRRTASFEGIHEINDGMYNPLNLSNDGCLYSIAVYPTMIYWCSIHSAQPIVLTVIITLVIALTIMLFLLYDRCVEKRQRYVLTKAAQSTAIVSSLFPKQVRDKMMEMQEDNRRNNNRIPKSHKLKAFLSHDGHDAPTEEESQIAELFPSCTVLFADIVGFTAWSSTREPQDVFVLLQTMFSTFDRIAKRRNVFKVETIGDCYMSVAGLPEPQANHFVIMCRFAWKCRIETPRMLRQLEKRLGPDCSDLVLRFGMHSGPVTAGVLKVDRPRFQLFGDTVNTASRMESTCIPDKIQMSQSTADLLIGVGKGHWIKPREYPVKAKGKGTMQTYWLSLKIKNELSSSKDCDIHSDLVISESTPTSNSFVDEAENKQDRLVDWMVDLLSNRIKPMIAQRRMNNMEASTKATSIFYQPPLGTTCLDEVKEVITIAEYANTIQGKRASLELDCTISEETRQDLRCYVKMIAQMYRDNPFHNFGHACHVTMSVNKLLQRIMSSDVMEEAPDDSTKGSNNKHLIQLHNYTHGLCFDYTASFAIVYSALIHDVDHRGCSNMQLIEEKQLLGAKYRNKSVAEQNSVDLAWDLLMDERFDSLRRVIFGNQAELMRSRQLVVNSVLATDIFDKELNDLRHNRWAKAFSEDPSNHDADHSNRRATIVLEHIIQASDVSHTMQHWHIYRKWNRLLFREMYIAFLQGRMNDNPATFWYEGELGFFDNYVIPLAKKLKECHVFGVSSDEYLNYAIENRAEWAARGPDMVAEMIQENSNL